MDITVITGDKENASLLREMYHVRAKIFKGRLGWSVRADKGLESDEFDVEETRYILVRYQNRVVGCARFLDFSGPTMVGSHFSTLLERPIASLTHKAVESSRFCVDTEALRQEGEALGGQATSLLISAMIGWAALHHYQTIITVTDVVVERLLRRLDVPFQRLGQPQQIENTRAVAGRVDVSAALGCKIMPLPLCRTGSVSDLTQAFAQ